MTTGFIQGEIKISAWLRQWCLRMKIWRIGLLDISSPWWQSCRPPSAWGRADSCKRTMWRTGVLETCFLGRDPKGSYGELLGLTHMFCSCSQTYLPPVPFLLGMKGREGAVFKYISLLGRRMEIVSLWGNLSMGERNYSIYLQLPCWKTGPSLSASVLLVAMHMGGVIREGVLGLKYSHPTISVLETYYK